MTPLISAHSSVLSSFVTSWWAPLRLSGDLSVVTQVGVLGLLFCTLILLAFEVRAQKNWKILLFASGALGSLLLSFAVMRPSRLIQKGHAVPGVGIILLDDSHRLEIPLEVGGESRRSLAERSAQALEAHWKNSRIQVQKFPESDLIAQLAHVAGAQGERPRAIVVVSDGRLTRPGPSTGAAWREEVKKAARGIKVHTISIANKNPRDRSIRNVGLTGSAIAHQAFSLALEIGCFPHSTCNDVEVVVRELIEGQEPVELVRGKTNGQEGIARFDLDVTLERAGERVIEVELLGDEADDIPQNDRRILPVHVERDRLRMLHVAGRPTYDVRALRMFLKSDESIALRSFFILRTLSDQVEARPDEMALIPFPVDELFSEHLKSFDAVILQDINAREYQLDRHFRSLKNYVLKGGGLILVGGHTGFSAGGYGGSLVADVLPVDLPRRGELITQKAFEPRYTEAGRAAPMLNALRATMGEELPTMSGANILGAARDNALVLWEHPSISLADGSKMPILALHEVGDGRTIAISVDGTHQLRFGDSGARAGGRAHADLWGGLLGWLMRDPRYEAAQLRLENDCIAGRDLLFRVDSHFSDDAKISLTLERLGTKVSDVRNIAMAPAGKDGGHRFIARGLKPGGYAARVKVGAAPPTRTVFACEFGGQAWADSRPDSPRLAAIAEATGGTAVTADDISLLAPPSSAFVLAQRESRPLLPPWAWATMAAFFMSLHWVVRRMVGAH